MAGMRPDTIAALERGASAGIQFDTLAKLCDALGCEPGDIFELEPECHAVPLLGGPDEDDIIRARVRESVAERVHESALAPDRDDTIVHAEKPTTGGGGATDSATPRTVESAATVSRR
jgi:transcriptional regulator with XRE-family HTH domain